MAELTLEIMANLVHDEGYKAQVEPGRYLRSATNGLRFLIFVDADGWLQLALTLARGARPITDVECGEFNRRFRFAKLYLDSDKDLTMCMDFFMGKPDADLKPFATECMSVWETSVGTMRRFIEQYPVQIATPALESPDAAPSTS